jgi:cation transporter-like permease
MRILGVSLIGAFYVSTLSSLIAYLKGFPFSPLPYLKILLITTLTTFFLVSLIAVIVIVAGNYFIKKKEDPDNTLIPITTSIADLGSMLIFSLLIYLLF